MSENIIEKIELFKEKSVLVIGDLMIDSYIWGEVNRISPEAPVPIVSCNKRESRLGGAANVALNIRALGAKPYLCSVIGNDDKAELVMQLLDNEQMPKNGIITDNERKTTVKFRIISQGQHLLRVDEENTDLLSPQTEMLFIKNIKKIIQENNIDIIVFEDYDKGVITEKIIAEIVNLANEKMIPTLVDPKKRNFNFYKGITIFKPNFKEFTEGLNLKTDKNNFSEIFKNIKQFISTQNIENLLLTLSEEGICIANKQECFHVPAEKRDIIDVSGAGDTVISVAALALAANMKIQNIAAISNIAGGLVCEKTGVVSVDINTLKEEIKRFYLKPKINIIES